MGRTSSDSDLQAREGEEWVKSARLVEQTCRWAKTPLPRRIETRLSIKSNTQQELDSCWANILRLAFASERECTATVGGVRDEPVGGRGQVVSAGKQKKKEQNEVAISTRTRPVTHLAGLPTTRVPPWYVAPIQDRKADPHPSEEGRGSQPLFRVEERERKGTRRRWWWERREHGTETDPASHASHVMTYDLSKSQPPHAQPQCMEHESK